MNERTNELTTGTYQWISIYTGRPTLTIFKFIAAKTTNYYYLFMHILGIKMQFYLNATTKEKKKQKKD